MFEYTARLIRIVDGDTVELDIDLGFDVHQRHAVRLAGVNAPEHNTPDGAAATAWLTQALGNHPLVIRTHKDQAEKYGRYLATIWVGDTNINDALVAAGHAVAYSGGKR
jgi:micrococcal nuclease